MRATRQRAGRRAGRRAGPAGRPALHRAARRRRRCQEIQSIFQRARLSRLAHAWRPHAYQLTLAQSAAARHTETIRERGGVHSAGAADRLRDGGGGLLAVRQLLVAGARGPAGGRLTRDGGRVHARVAPAPRGRLARRIAQPRAAPAAPSAAPRARLTAIRRHAPLRRGLPAALLTPAPAHVPASQDERPPHR